MRRASGVRFAGNGLVCGFSAEKCCASERLSSDSGPLSNAHSSMPNSARHTISGPRIFDSQLRLRAVRVGLADDSLLMSLSGPNRVGCMIFLHDSPACSLQIEIEASHIVFRVGLPDLRPVVRLYTCIHMWRLIRWCVDPGVHHSCRSVPMCTQDWPSQAGCMVLLA